MSKCERCGREKTWQGDDPNCPFKNGDVFGDNWNCGQINKIRELCELAEETETYLMNYQYCDDEKYVTINVDVVELDVPALCLWVCWYKRRGRTDAMWLLSDSGEPRKPTFDELQQIYDYYMDRINKNEKI